MVDVKIIIIKNKCAASLHSVQYSIKFDVTDKKYKKSLILLVIGGEK